MTRVAPGLYLDEGAARSTLHFDIPEMLRAHGWADTPENRETLAQVAREACASQFPGVPVRED